MIPLKDINPTRTAPILTVLLIVVNCGVFVHQALLPPAAWKTLFETWGVVPAALTDAALHHPAAFGHAAATLMSAMFLHGSVLHLALNMLYLWIFGNNIEDAMGRVRFLVFYAACGVFASLAQVAVAPYSRAPMIGASGAISGILGAYLVLFPTARVLTLVIIVVFFRVVSIPAVIVLGVWFLLQLLSAEAGQGSGIAVMAHVGGFVAGCVLVVVFRRRKSRESLF